MNAHDSKRGSVMAIRPVVARTLLIAGLGLTLAAACADASADEGRAMPRVVPPAYTEECGSCHTAYAPGLLPAPSWQRLMDGLARHFGTDASTNAATVKQLGAWLDAHAGTYKRVSEAPPQDRITRSAWFTRKHRKVEASVWPLPSVMSAANCAACHAGADQGRFDDDDLLVPAGLTLRQRRAWSD